MGADEAISETSYKLYDWHNSVARIEIHALFALFVQNGKRKELIRITVSCQLDQSV